MIFHGLKYENGWAIIDYQTANHYGYDFMLEIAQELIRLDYKDNLDKLSYSKIVGAPEINIIDEVKQNQNILRNTKTLQEERGTITIAGVSSVFKFPLQYTFYNQTNAVKVYALAEDVFKEHGEHFLDLSMDILEINAYCKIAERRTRAECQKIYSEKTDDRHGARQVDRTQLCDYMNDIDKNIRSMAPDEKSRVIQQKVSKILRYLEDKPSVMVLNNVPKRYLSNRQITTLKNSIRCLDRDEVLDAYWEIYDFVYDYGENKNTYLNVEEYDLLVFQLERILNKMNQVGE